MLNSFLSHLNNTTPPCQSAFNHPQLSYVSPGSLLWTPGFPNLLYTSDGSLMCYPVSSLTHLSRSWWYFHPDAYICCSFSLLPLVKSSTSISPQTAFLPNGNSSCLFLLPSILNICRLTPNSVYSITNKLLERHVFICLATYSLLSSYHLPPSPIDTLPNLGSDQSWPHLPSSQFPPPLPPFIYYHLSHLSISFNSSASPISFTIPIPRHPLQPSHHCLKSLNTSSAASCACTQCHIYWCWTNISVPPAHIPACFMTNKV